MKINIHLFIFIIIAVLTSINDLFIYAFNFNYGISLLISSILLAIILTLFLRKKVVSISSDFNRWDLIYIIPVVLFSCILMVRCDYSYDTKNYHIYNQEHYFDDKINFDCFVGRTINSFLFPLGDRMYYMFRYFLGYRLGVVLSFYTLIIMFYQMKNILKTMIPNISEKNLIQFSIVPSFLWCVNEFIGTYYIDNFSSIILLELIYIFIKQENIFKDKMNLYYISILLGIATGIKLPNLILGCIIVGAILINNIVKYKIQGIKENWVSIKNVIIILILFFLPFIVYMIDNYIQTGSPLYPYYNTIFKSEYFGEINWNDENFGIPNFISAFAWPIIITLNPLKGNNVNIVDCIWLIGYIASYIYVIICPKKYNITYKLSILAIAISIIWAIFLMGYARYAIVIPIVYIIVLVNIFMELDKQNVIQEVIAEFIILVFIGLFYFQLPHNIDKIKQSFNSIYLSKYQMQNDGDVYEIDGVWGSINDNSAMITLIRDENVPIYNLDSWHYMYCDKTKELYYEKIKNKKIYTITDDYKYNSTLEHIEDEKFEIVGEPKIYRNYKIQEKNKPWYIIELKYVGE